MRNTNTSTYDLLRMVGFRDDVCVAELTDQVLDRHVVDVRHADTGYVAILEELCSHELFVVGTRVVMRIKTSHNGSRNTHGRALHVLWH